MDSGEYIVYIISDLDRNSQRNRTLTRLPTPKTPNFQVNAAGFPPAKFEFYPHTVELAYQEDNLTTGMSVAVVMMVGLRKYQIIDFVVYRAV